MAGLVTFYTYDLMTLNVLSAGLPFTGVTFGSKLNAAGSFSGALNLADKRVQKMAPRQSTPTGRTILVVDIDGSIEWAGIIWTRTPTRTAAAKTCPVTGIEFESYFSARVQAADYTTTSLVPGSKTYWDPTLGTAADACRIAAQLIHDAIGVPGSALSLLTINILESASNPNTILASYPITQLQAVDTMLATLAAGGYGTGFEFAFDVSWANGPGSSPAIALNISYPRRGRIAGSTGLVVSEPIIEYSWPEDASQQGNSQHGSASSLSLTAQAGPDEAVLGAGWPLLERVQSYAAVNTPGALNAALSGDLARLEWPVVTPKIKVPLFGSTVAIGDFILGDDARVVFGPDEWFDTAVDTYMRIVQSDVALPDQGLPTMQLTFGQLPGLAPATPLPA